MKGNGATVRDDAVQLALGGLEKSRMSDASKAIDRFLRAYADPILKDAGFGKLRRKYRRQVGDRQESISISAHTFNYQERASFEIGASIFIPEIARALGREVLDLAKVQGFECGVFCNARQLMPQGRLFRGIVTLDETANQEQGQLLIEGLRTGVFPWFERLREPDSLIAYVQKRADFNREAWSTWAQSNGIAL